MNASTSARIGVGLLTALLAIAPNVGAAGDGGVIAIIEKIDDLDCSAALGLDTSSLAAAPWVVDACDPDTLAFCLQSGNPCGFPDPGAATVHAYYCNADPSLDPPGYITICFDVTHVNLQEWSFEATGIACWPGQGCEPFGFGHALGVFPQVLFRGELTIPLSANGVCGFVRNASGLIVAADCI